MTTLGLPDLRRFTGFAALIVALCLLAACAAVPKTDDPKIPPEVVGTAEAYIAKNKKWPRETYNLAITQRKDDFIVLAVYRNEDGNFEDRENVDVPIELTITLESPRVVRELGYR
ncbi:MAG: hypothetical protein QNJ67_19730 [Kiloniellales bacterium]|nr:hypothetical protein [Kiloniellales bacterium]